MPEHTDLDPLPVERSYPQYPWPWKVALEILLSAARRQPRSFRKDAVACLAQAHLHLHVDGKEALPACGPVVITFNHYSRPGFGAWWIALAIGAKIPVEIHWSMTAAWTEDGSFKSYIFAEASRRLFPRVARIYGFTPMPPMPPRPSEVSARAIAVRHLLYVAKSQPSSIIALSPEGQDSPGGVLMRPHPGVGRFLLQLARLGYPIQPTGVYEEAGALCLRFGLPFRLELPSGLPRDVADRLAGELVMQGISDQLPPHLRGEFAV
jgi:1-acyl-sn-glycerol-3-phosphate acyltransferase